METLQTKAAAVTIEDIVFEKRNKAYGAYFLYTKSTKYLLIAFLVTLTTVSSSVLIPFIKAVRNLGVGAVIDFPKTSFITVPIPKEDIDALKMPQMPTPPTPKNIITTATYVPIISDNVSNHEVLPTVSDILDVNNNKQIDNNPDFIPIDKLDPFPPDSIEAPVFCPKEYASFQDGDLNTFRTWVQKSIVYPTEAQEYGITGRLYVQFCVNKKGEVIEVKILNKANPLLERETIRVLNSSPKWKPAKQGGYEVKQQFSMPIIFKI